MTIITVIAYIWDKKRPQWKSPSERFVLYRKEEADEPASPDDYFKEALDKVANKGSSIHGKQVVLTGEYQENPEKTYYKAKIVTTDGSHNGFITVQYGSFLDYRRRKSLLKEVGSE